MGIPISQLPELTNADEGDLIPIVDVSGNVTKRVAPEGLAAVVAVNLSANSVDPAAIKLGCKVGVISSAVLGSTGLKAVTGLGFKPRLVRFTVMPSPSASFNMLGFGAMDEAGSQFWAAGSSSTAHARSSGTDGCVGWIPQTSSTPSLLASYSSMNADGFTINVITAASAFSVGYEAYA